MGEKRAETVTFEAAIALLHGSGRMTFVLDSGSPTAIVESGGDIYLVTCYGSGEAVHQVSVCDMAALLALRDAVDRVIADSEALDAEGAR